jgi:anaerobic magnesium-protoporphyrin IX monomethyl ester cyclase
MSDLKILLIQAPDRRVDDNPLAMVPLGLAYLAACARQAGHDVTIIDASGEGLSWPEFTERVSVRKWDVIGITALTPVFDSVKRAMEICRPFAEFLVIGGAHPMALRDRILAENPELDAAVIGEGEETFVEMLDAIASDGDLSNIAGLATPDSPAVERPRIQQLDKVPFPARDLLPTNRYRYALSGGRRVATLISSRGCPFNCVFCDKGVCGSRWRGRTAENVLAEIDELVTRYRTQYIIFYDDLFVFDRDRLMAICDGLIERKYRLKWKAEARVDTVDAEMLKKMRRAGCDIVGFGVESANPHGLEYLNKKTTPEKARNAFAMARAAGLKTVGYFILGIPVETYDDALNSIKFAIDIGVDYADFHVLSPMPGTLLYEQTRADGSYREVHAQNFIEKDPKRPVIVSENWSEEQLVSIIAEAHKRFFMRPGYILRRLMSIRSFGDLAALFKLGARMLSCIKDKKTKVSKMTAAE